MVYIYCIYFSYLFGIIVIIPSILTYLKYIKYRIYFILNYKQLTEFKQVPFMIIWISHETWQLALYQYYKIYNICLNY